MHGAMIQPRRRLTADNMGHEPNRFEAAIVCPACGGRKIRPFKKGNLDLSDIGSEAVKITDNRYGQIWDLSRCKDCGHIFADPCPAPAFLNSLYAGLEDPLYEEESEGRENNFLSVLSRLERLRPEKGRLCDVGAATGILMNLARRRGWQVDGVEPSAWAASRARHKYGFRIHESSFESARLESGAYDAVTMIDFIEHTARPLQAVRKAAEVLRGGGLLCLVTPDIRSLAARISGPTWWHFRPAHLGYFTRESLGALFKDAGFSVVRRRTYAWTFSAHYLTSRKAAFRFLLKNKRLASFLKTIPIKLALGDSFEIYARKEEPK